MFRNFCQHSLHGVVLFLLPTAKPLNGMRTLGALRS